MKRLVTAINSLVKYGGVDIVEIYQVPLAIMAYQNNSGKNLTYITPAVSSA